MQALVYYGPGDLRLEERPDPARTADNLVAQVRACAICGTDLKISLQGNPRCHPPRILGHEMVGTVVHVGRNVRGFEAGDRVTLATTLACGECPTCRRGLGNMCPQAKPISYDFDGAFAEYVGIPPLALRGGNAVKVPDGVPDAHAALSEPISCAINAQQLIGMGPGQTVLIVGGGPLGAIHAEVAKALGAARVIVTQRSEPRLSFLRELRDVSVWQESGEELKRRIMAETSGEGADAVIVCAPSREPQEDAVSLARKGGAVSLFASLPAGKSQIALDSRLLHYRELRVVGASDSRPEHVREAVQWMAAGRLAADRLVTHRIALAEFQQGLDLMRDKKSLKVLVYPDAAGLRAGR